MADYQVRSTPYDMDDPANAPDCDCGWDECICPPLHRCRNPRTCEICEDGKVEVRDKGEIHT